VGRRGDHGSLIETLDALVHADPTAYVADRHGRVANPSAPCSVRDAMHHLADLVFKRDGRYLPWWRAVGEEP
jgi:hypothetical protein